MKILLCRICRFQHHDINKMNEHKKTRKHREKFKMFKYFIDKNDIINYKKEYENDINYSLNENFNNENDNVENEEYFNNDIDINKLKEEDSLNFNKKENNYLYENYYIKTLKEELKLNKKCLLNIYNIFELFSKLLIKSDTVIDERKDRYKYISFIINKLDTFFTKYIIKKYNNDYLENIVKVKKIRKLIIDNFKNNIDNIYKEEVFDQDMKEEEEKVFNILEKEKFIIFLELNILSDNYTNYHNLYNKDIDVLFDYNIEEEEREKRIIENINFSINSIYPLPFYNSSDKRRLEKTNVLLTELINILKKKNKEIDNYLKKTGSKINEHINNNLSLYLSKGELKPEFRHSFFQQLILK